jgi:glycosyltransferase involved in cell wall biosynthesis
MAHVFMAVINDLHTDQRVHRVCLALTEAGHSVHLFGSASKMAPVLQEKPWKQERLPRWFSKNILRYAELNIRLVFRMLKGSPDVIYANDTDVLAACCLVAALRRKPLIFDSHEFFTGVPELSNSPLKRKIWTWVESLCIKRCVLRFTVNQSIANLLEERYGHSFLVLRNVPLALRSAELNLSRKDFGLPEDAFIVILQGSGINVQRGGEELVESMALLPESIHLIIAGSGDVYDSLKRQSQEAGLKDRVHFLGRMPYSRLMQLTACCNLGVSLDKPLSVNYTFSLPNKLFDYMHAGIPSVCSDLPEVGRMVREYGTGLLIQEVTPREIASTLLKLYENKALMAELRENCKKAAIILNWENEKRVLLEAFKMKINV